jgi:hypothetical protein
VNGTSIDWSHFWRRNIHGILPLREDIPATRVNAQEQYAVIQQQHHSVYHPVVRIDQQQQLQDYHCQFCANQKRVHFFRVENNVL